MIDTTQNRWQTGVSMPSSWATTVASTVAVCTLPPMGEVSAVAVAASTKRRVAYVAPVCAHIATTDVFVLEGAFPGTSAWSPPI